MTDLERTLATERSELVTCDDVGALCALASGEVIFTAGPGRLGRIRPGDTEPTFLSHRLVDRSTVTVSWVLSCRPNSGA